MTTHPPEKDYCSLFFGLDIEVPLLDGRKTRYINFDNAASTPPLRAVQQAVNDFMNYYSSVHRGAGFKSQLSTHFYEEARLTVMRFVGADPKTHTCIFVKNTTEAINKLAFRFPFTDKRDIVITSEMEHHSNDLPWRKVAEVVHVHLRPDGRLDLDDYERKLEKYGNQIALVAIAGGCNVTGHINPIHALAKKCHAVGAQFMADCAQLAPHRKVDMLPLKDPRHIDYIAISAHKMYAPYGVGALIGRKDTFESGPPDMVGGGVVENVTLEDVVWTKPPNLDEAGSPNPVGAVAMAVAANQLETIGMENVASHEAELTAHALRRLPEVRGLRLYGDNDPNNAIQRLGTIPFNIENIDNSKVAAILGHEFGIGIRNGRFCAHPLILHLLSIDEKKADQLRQCILDGDKSEIPGLARISFGLYNTIDEVDTLIEALKTIANSEYMGEYPQDKSSGDYRPIGWEPKFEEYFSLEVE